MEGVAVAADTGEPLRKVTVTVRRIADAPVMDTSGGLANGPATATTDAGGKYRIGNLQPGRYRMTAEHIGFLVQQYGLKPGGANQAGTIVALAPGQKMLDAGFRLVRQGVITGRVLDEDGDPMQNVGVSCMRQTYVRGRKQWMPVNGQATNDLGEFRIHSLAPGRYLLTATYRLNAMSEEMASAQESYAPTYYPGAQTPEAAGPIEVTSGAQLRGMDIRLQKTRTIRIRGRVAGAPGRLGRGTMVRVVPRSENFTAFGGRGTRVLDSTGAFTMAGVTPGSYWLIAESQDDNEVLMARMPIDVGSANIDDVTLTLSRPAELTGLVKAGACQTKGSVLRGQLEALPEFEVKEDGKFVVKGVRPEAYRVHMYGLPGGCYVKSIQFGDTDVTGTGLDFSQGIAAGELIVTLADGAAQLDGTVETGKQEPANSAWVVLIPEGKRSADPQSYRAVSTDQSGQYSVKGIVPGEYRLYAFDQVEPGAYQDPEFMKPFESKGVKVSLKEGGRETQNLKLLDTTP